MKHDDLLECYVCGSPARWLVAIGGEDEPPTEEAACERHSVGHRHRALLTMPPAMAMSMPTPPGHPARPDELPDPDREHRPDEPRHPGAPPQEPSTPSGPMPHPVPAG